MPVKFIKPKRFVNKVFLHCSASDKPEQDNVESLKELHISPTTKIFHWGDYKEPVYGKGWKDIGYHFVITKDGVLHAGRSLELIPAAQLGYNAGSIAICLTGNDINKFTLNQYNTLRFLCDDINTSYSKQITFHGHKEVEPKKTCPVYDYKRILTLDDKGYINL